MSPKQKGTNHGPRSGPPGDATAYLMPRDLNVWEAAWANHLGRPAPVPIDVTRPDADPGEPDPAKKALHDEAMAYVKAYTGSWGLVLDIRANPRFGMARFRLSERQVEVLLAGKARDLARLERESIDRELYADREYQTYVAGLIALGNAVVEELEPGTYRGGHSETGDPDTFTVPAPVTEGMYRMPDATIAKVQRAVHGSQRLYAKRLDPETGDFEYAPGLFGRLRAEDRMTVEDAKAFGLLYGRCIVCGRTLTDEKSIADGIGPVCAGKV